MTNLYFNEKSFLSGAIINKEKTYGITFLNTAFTIVSIKLVDKRNKEKQIFDEASNFQWITKRIAEDGFRIPLEEWAKAIKDNGKSFKEIHKMPEELQLALDNKIVYDALIKYGEDSKQFKAIIKLYKD